MPEPIENQYFLAGHVSRSHGVDGTVLIVPVIEAAHPALFDEIEIVRLQNERGDLVPARIASVKTQKKDDRISFFVKFEHINNRNKAEQVTRKAVFIDKEKVETFIAESHPWISFKVFSDGNEHIGTVEGVVQNPAHLILEVSTDIGHRLIPCVDEYIIEVDEDKQVIRCQNLNQLETL